MGLITQKVKAQEMANTKWKSQDYSEVKHEKFA